MSADQKNHKVQITIAIIGLAGVLGSALLTNWDKVFPASEKNELVVRDVDTRGAVSEGNNAIISLPSSFDCRKAETKIEKIICDNPKISHVDGQLGLLYKKLRNKMPADEFNALKLAQREWIKNRDKRILDHCQSLEGLDTSCVITIYKLRIDEFKTQLENL